MQTARPPRPHRRPEAPPRATAFRWGRCALHPQLILSVILLPDVEPWCVGLPDDDDPIAGHWLDPEQVAA